MRSLINIGLVHDTRAFPQNAPYYMTIQEGISFDYELFFRHLELSMMAEDGES